MSNTFDIFYLKPIKFSPQQPDDIIGLPYTLALLWNMVVKIQDQFSESTKNNSPFWCSQRSDVNAYNCVVLNIHFFPQN